MNTRGIPIVDAYTHCGISKYLPIDDVSATMERSGVSRAVLAQHLGEFDNTYIQGVVANAPDRFAGVCLVDHADATARETLDELAQSSTCQGIRWPMASDVDNLDLVAATLERGLIVVAYFPESVAANVDALASLVRRHPAGRIVVSHLGNPAADDDDPLNTFREAGVFDLLTAEGLIVQLSGMEMTTVFPHRELHPLVGAMFETVGADRLTWGSNFPVVGTPEDYQAELQLLLDGGLPIPAGAIPAVAGGTALRIWFAGE